MFWNNKRSMFFWALAAAAACLVMLFVNGAAGVIALVAFIFSVFALMHYSKEEVNKGATAFENRRSRERLARRGWIIKEEP